MPVTTDSMELREQYAATVGEAIRVLQKLQGYREYYFPAKAALPELDKIWLSLKATKKVGA